MPGPPTIRLLIVDDDTRVRAALQRTIAMEPTIEIVADAADAKMASELANQTRPSVALVDLLLPDVMTGLQLVGELSEIEGCSVVAMSVRSSLRRPAVAAGACSFVEKDSDIDAILSAVRSAG